MNNDAPTDTSYDSPPFEHSSDSQSYNEDMPIGADSMLGPSGVTAGNTDMFSPIIHELDSQEDHFVLPQVTIFTLFKLLTSLGGTARVDE